MLKNRSLFILLILLLIAVLAVLSCGRKGSLNPNIAPYIEISDYSGIARPDTVLTDSSMFNAIGGLIDPEIYDSLFFQEIYWKAWDIDGVVKSFAYRIGTWDSLSRDWKYDQTYGVRVSEDGWVLHLQPNGEYDIWSPLKERFPKTQVYFTATDTTDYKKNFGKFEVMCKDNYDEQSEIAARYFCSWSDVPSTSVSTSQGKLDTVRVGTALNFQFNVIKDDDPYGYGSEAAYFKYRLEYFRTEGTDTLDIPEAGIDSLISVTDWYTTESFSDPKYLELRREYTDGPARPQLRVNRKFSDGTFELTKIVVKSVDKAGIADPDSASLMFFVRDYFTPETCPFMSSTYDWPSNYSKTLFGSADLNITPHIYVLGDHSNLNYLSSSQDDVPSRLILGQKKFADRFYVTLNNEACAFYSSDVEVYMKWRYLGERQYIQDKQATGLANQTYSYDPNFNKYEKYFCDIEYMDIQLDGDITSLPPVGEAVTDNITGENWRRIPITEDQECKLFGLTSGEHTFRVRAVDVQGAVDPSPEAFVFKFVDLIDSSEKEGFLLIDDTFCGPSEITFAQEDSVDNYYKKLINSLIDSTDYVVFDLEDDILTDCFENNMTFRGEQEIMAPYISPFDIQQYKFILWHSNNTKQQYPSSKGNVHLVNNYDVLTYYVKYGGNLLFTGCYGITDPEYSRSDFLQNYAGLADTLSGDNALDFFWSSFPTVNNSPLGGVSGTGSFSGIVVDSFNVVSTVVNPFPQYWIMTPLEAIGSITYLNVRNADIIFTSVPGPYFPDPDPYTDLPIASVYTNDPGVSGTVYTFGFPLFYFDVEQTKEIISQVLDEVGVAHN